MHTATDVFSGATHHLQDEVEVLQPRDACHEAEVHGAVAQMTGRRQALWSDVGQTRSDRGHDVHELAAHDLPAAVAAIAAVARCLCRVDAAKKRPSWKNVSTLTRAVTLR